jgi:hypothetical protein
MSMANGKASAFGGVILNSPPKNWYCPECGKTHVTKMSDPHTQMHQCASLRGAWVPFVEAGVQGRLQVNYREDYIKKDIAVTDGDGNIIQSVSVKRNDGEDCVILAPSTNLNLRS